MIKQSVELTKDQVIGSIANVFNEIREQDLNQALNHLNELEQLNLSNQEEVFMSAMTYVDKIKEVLSKPENILGSEKTKFGEIAEVVEVNFRNAHNILEGKLADASFEGIGRTAPADYSIDGINVQSKFINGLNNNLKHVLDHMDKYSDFSESGYYHIPKDSFDVISKINRGESVQNLSSKTVGAIKDKIAAIELQSGKSFEEVIKPASSNYSDVQLNRVGQTIENKEINIKQQNQEIQNEIKQDTEQKKVETINIHKPSLQEAAKVGIIAAIIGGVTSGGVSIYLKCKNENKSLSDFTVEDWKDVGYDFGKGSLKGGINGVAIYGLTNFTSLGAPIASGVVSATWGLASLVKDYNQNKISSEEFYLQGQIICLESSVTTVGALIGQSVIPIPVVGALVGSISAQMLCQLTKNHIGEKEKELRLKASRHYYLTMAQIEGKYQNLIVELMEKYNKLDGIIGISFNFDLNTSVRLSASAEMAREIGVPNEEVLTSIKEIDNYFL